MAKKGETADMLPIVEVTIPILEPTADQGVIKIAPDVASVLRQAAKLYKIPVGKLADAPLRKLARGLLEQMKAHIASLELSESFDGE